MGKIWSHLDLEWDLQTRVRILLTTEFSAFTLDIQMEISLISKSDDSKTQIHLHIQDYNFHDELQVR
jgi:hypothetical protein